jgi:hypothetical protein
MSEMWPYSRRLCKFTHSAAHGLKVRLVTEEQVIVTFQLTEPIWWTVMIWIQSGDNIKVYVLPIIPHGVVLIS